MGINLLLILSFSFIFELNSYAQKRIQINISPTKEEIEISPNIYGQFIEHLRNSITGGIFQEDTALSDSVGFRKDVLVKMKELQVPVLRYPGGTVTKIYHWKDGIGPRAERPARPNLIWGGVEDNHFGTDEYIKYCREIGAQPSIVVNMSTGTAEEAANWVEYCNGTSDTYYANLRRKYASEEPYHVKFWSLGNEEAAREDAGRLYNPEKYAEESWYYAKLMKLTAPSIKLFMVADPLKNEWNDVVLKSLSPICDYISVHWYIGTSNDDPNSIYQQINRFDTCLTNLGVYLEQFPKQVENFPQWYRFPPREEAIKISVDEWGIWESDCGGQYNLDCDYTWKHALATASFLNMLHRQAQNVKMANWAQSVNILGAILANDQGSVEQTVFYPLKYFRKYVGNEKLELNTENMSFLDTEKTIPALDISATFNKDSKEINVFLVNRSENSISTDLNISHFQIRKGKRIEMTAPDLFSRNTIGEASVVKINHQEIRNLENTEIKPFSINIYNLTADEKQEQKIR